MELSEFLSAGVEAFDWMDSTLAGADAGVGAALFLVGIDVFGFADGVFVEGDWTVVPSCCFEAAVFETAVLGAVDLGAGEAFTGFLDNS